MYHYSPVGEQRIFIRRWGADTRFGIVLEQDGEGSIVVVEVEPTKSAGRAGVKVGDVLVAVQNVSIVSSDLTEVLDFIANRCPRVINLRFQRLQSS
mmetsp:Transcript_4323/g.7865  ORF Transcript_4323/g.7865 Transcript_4323/m.7865 type:complete len:96 (+) Transcript_4323:180-467(+)